MAPQQKLWLFLEKIAQILSILYHHIFETIKSGGIFDILFSAALTAFVDRLLLATQFL